MPIQKIIKINKPFASHTAAVLLGWVALFLQFAAPAAWAGVVTITYTLQQGNEQTNGVAYAAGTGYSGVVDGAISDSSGTAVLSSTTTSTIGNQYRTGSPNGQQFCGLFSYDLTDLNNFIATNTGPYSSVAITSCSFQLVSAGVQNGSSGIGLYGTDPFTSSCTWSNYTTGTPWTAPYQNIGSSVQYGYTGGGSALTAGLGGSNPNTGITNGNALTWTSNSNFIKAVTNAIARSDKKLYLTANVGITAYSGGSDYRVNVNFSPTATVANRPQLTVILQITTTAAPTTWTGASDTSWATAGNWSPSTVPLTDSPIIFNSSSSAHLNTVLNQNFTVLSLSVTNPTGPVSIGGASSLTIDAGGIDLSAATQNLTISAPVVLGFGQTWNVAGSRTLSVNSGVSGTAALTISGGGKVSLGGAATYTGDTTVSAGGTLQMGAANALPNGASAGNIITFGTLDLNGGNAESVNALNGSGIVDNAGGAAATLTVGNNNASNTNFTGVIQNTSGTLALVKTGTGSLTLSGTNTYSGGTTIANGSVVPGNGSVFGTGTVTNFGTAYAVVTMTITNPLVLNGGYLRVGGGSDTVIWSGPVTVTNGFVMGGDNNGNVNNVSGSINIGIGGIYVTNNTGNGQAQAVLGDILSGTISGSGGITYYCSGGNSRLTVQGANTYSGGTIVNGTSNGKLNVYGGVNPFSTGTVTLNAGVVIEAYPGNVTITNALTLNGGMLEGESQYNDYNRLTWAGPITLTANSALFQFGQNNSQMSQGVNVSGSLNLNGYTLTNSGNSGLYSGNIISGSISGVGTILETVNILYLQGSNTFNGTFRSVGGNITVQNVNAMQNATLDMNAADSGSVTLMSGAVIGALTGSRNVNLGGFAVSIGNNNASTTFSGALTNTGSMTKIGSGTLTLTGANTYTGGTTISGGTLALSGSGSLASTNITVAGGATLDISAVSFTLGAGQVLSNTASATAQLVGPLSSGSGTISVSFVNGTPSFNVAGGALNLSASTILAVRNTGATLTPGTYKIISKSGGGSVAGTVPTSVSVVNGPTAGTPSVSIVGGELYLTVGGASSIGYTASGPFTYSGVAQSPSANFTGSTSTHNSTYVGVSLSYGPSVSAPTNAGTYYLTNTVVADANYFGATNSQGFTILPTALGIAANNDSKTYNGLGYTGGNGVTYSGFVNSETLAVLGGTLVYGGTSQNSTNAGTYTIAPSGQTSGNYTISYTNGTLTINQAASVINTAPTASAITYGQMLSDSTLSGGSATPAGGSFAFTAPSTVPSVGTASYGVTYTPLDTINYTSASTTVSVTVNSACTSPTIVGGISPASLTATVGDQVILSITNVTGTAPFGYQWLSNSVVIASATNSSYTNLSVLVTDAGNYQVIITNDCGAITSSVAVLTVNPQTPLIATLPTAANITYGQALSAATLSGGSVTNAAGATITGSFTYNTPTNVPSAGTPAASVTFTPNDTNNYNNVSTSVSVTVNPAALGVTANSDSKTYNGIGYTGGNGVTYSGFVNGDTTGSLSGSLSYGGTSQNVTNAGTYTIVPSGLTSANYTISYTNGTLTVNLASTSVAIASSKNPSGYRDSVSFNASLPIYATGNVVFTSPSGAFSTNGIVTGSATSLALTNLARGTNVITVAYLGDGNYLGSTNTLSQTVTNHPPVVNNAGYTRNVAVDSFKVLVSDLLTNASDVDGDSLTLVAVGTSTNGVTPSISGGWVLYANTNAVADQFSYTVSDGYGGTNSATLSIAIDSTPLFGQSEVVSTISGTATLSFAGIPTYSYSVNRSTNLTDWATIWTTNAPVGGVFQFIDTAAPTPSAYYRLQYNP